MIDAKRYAAKELPLDRESRQISLTIKGRVALAAFRLKQQIDTMTDRLRLRRKPNAWERSPFPKTPDVTGASRNSQDGGD